LSSKPLLDYRYIDCSGAFLTLLYVKANPVALSQRLEAVPIDSRMMNKYIRTVFLFNKTVALAVMEPLHDSVSHSDNLLSYEFSLFLPSGCHLWHMDLSLRTKPARQ
jgi:hypothetical protein